MLTERKRKAAAETDSRDRATEWRKGSYSNPEFIMSPLPRARKTPVRRATPSDSDTGTQVKKEPFCRNYGNPTSLKRGFNRALRFGIGDSHTFARRYAPSNAVLCLSRLLEPASPHGDAMLHGTSNRHSYLKLTQSEAPGELSKSRQLPGGSLLTIFISTNYLFSIF